MHGSRQTLLTGAFMDLYRCISLDFVDVVSQWHHHLVVSAPCDHLWRWWYLAFSVKWVSHKNNNLSSIIWYRSIIFDVLLIEWYREEPRLLYVFPKASFLMVELPCLNVFEWTAWQRMTTHWCSYGRHVAAFDEKLNICLYGDVGWYVYEGFFLYNTPNDRWCLRLSMMLPFW